MIAGEKALLQSVNLGICLHQLKLPSQAPAPLPLFDDSLTVWQARADCQSWLQDVPCVLELNCAR